MARGMFKLFLCACFLPASLCLGENARTWEFPPNFGNFSSSELSAIVAAGAHDSYFCSEALTQEIFWQLYSRLEHLSAENLAALARNPTLTPQMRTTLREKVHDPFLEAWSRFEESDDISVAKEMSADDFYLFIQKCLLKKKNLTKDGIIWCWNNKNDFFTHSLLARFPNFPEELYAEAMSERLFHCVKNSETLIAEYEKTRSPLALNALLENRLLSEGQISAFCSRIFEIKDDEERESLFSVIFPYAEPSSVLRIAEQTRKEETLIEIFSEKSIAETPRLRALERILSAEDVCLSDDFEHGFRYATQREMLNTRNGRWALALGADTESAILECIFERHLEENQYALIQNPALSVTQVSILQSLPWNLEKLKKQTWKPVRLPVWFYDVFIARCLSSGRPEAAATLLCVGKFSNLSFAQQRTLLRLFKDTPGIAGRLLYQERLDPAVKSFLLQMLLAEGKSAQNKILKSSE